MLSCRRLQIYVRMLASTDVTLTKHQRNKSSTAGVRRGGSVPSVNELCELALRTRTDSAGTVEHLMYTDRGDACALLR